MASISTDRDGKRKIQFTLPGNKRETFYMGKVSLRDATKFKNHVEALLTAQSTGFPLAEDTARWLADLPTETGDKLAAVGLVARPRM